MKIKTSELIGPALDWAVAKCRGFDGLDDDLWLIRDGIADMPLHAYTPSTDWAQGGPIIDVIDGFQLKVWLESRPQTKCEAHIHSYDGDYVAFGPTILIAAMRCFVASRLGDEVDVPKESLCTP